MFRRKLGQLKGRVTSLVDAYRYPYLAVDKMPEERPSLESIQFLINQLGKHEPVGLTHNVATGYHELPFPSLRFRTSRGDLDDRLRRFKGILHVDGSHGLDIGCAIGGLTFGLQQMGAHMVGIDRDMPSINVAQECEALFQTGASFVCGSFSEQMLASLLPAYANPSSGRFDFAIWFSSFNWVAEALGPDAIKKLLQALSSGVDTLVADSAIGGKGANALSAVGITSNETFVAFILDNSSYKIVDTVGVDTAWYGRNVYCFSR